MVHSKRTSATVPLKRSDTSTEDDAVQGDPMRYKRQKLGESAEQNGFSQEDVKEAGPVLAKDSTDSVDLRELESHREEELARIREKRKRAEDEEDDVDFLLAKKQPQDKDKENSRVGLAAAKSKNVSGKLKLFFGKKP